jgi:prepilin-type N-terminal cleavage/methylation domain-containing protein
MKRKGLLESHGGFTLVEIIAVMIIVAIMAAVAVAQYRDVTQDSHQYPIDEALSNAFARYNMAYARYTLENSEEPTTLASLNLDGDLVDFTATWTPSTPGPGYLTITITDGPSWFAGSSATKTKVIPSDLT